MCALGFARFHLRNATLSGRIYTYNLQLLPHGTYAGISRAQLLPLYGNICARFLVQPSSITAPIAESNLDVFFIEGGMLLQNIRCVLQGAQLKCFKNKQKMSNLEEKSILNLLIDQVIL